MKTIKSILLWLVLVVALGVLAAFFEILLSAIVVVFLVSVALWIIMGLSWASGVGKISRECWTCGAATTGKNDMFNWEGLKCWRCGHRFQGNEETEELPVSGAAKQAGRLAKTSFMIALSSLVAGSIASALTGKADLPVPAMENEHEIRS